MDILELILKDHEKVRGIMDQLEKPIHSKRITKTVERNFEKLDHEAQVHMRAEEDVFYPALQQFEKAKDKVMESLEEHHVVKVLLGEMKKLSFDDDHFAAKFMVFKENVLHHMQEEESNVFEMCRDLLEEEQLDEIGKQFAADKKKVMQTV